ncbi:ROK family protein [Paenibacillus agaridevorans]|uniref:ROK family protein n=1 Tax=Paenibacillus agaridevorans TaxID=171404 RepID=UPI001FE480B9|nr:ROK family protein [Paenibacillus agaridevorans]
MTSYAIVFDVGGNFIKSAIMTRQGQVLLDTVGSYPSRSHLEKPEMLDYLANMVQLQASKVPEGGVVQRIGYAFPGPFDYERGISYMSGIGKFDKLYGVSVGRELIMRLQGDESVQAWLATDARIVFGNDATLFALGEAACGTASRYHRSICITIGTGLGSAFIDRGVLVKDRSDVPLNGWLFNLPFGNGIADDYISKRGILAIAKGAGLHGMELDVKDLADRARAGDKSCNEIFREFGRNLGLVLKGAVDAYRPEAIVIGGQIAKSAGLFIGEARKILNHRNLEIHAVEETSLSTFAGILNMVIEEQEERGDIVDDEP